MPRRPRRAPHDQAAAIAGNKPKNNSDLQVLCIRKKAFLAPKGINRRKFCTYPVACADPNSPKIHTTIAPGYPHFPNLSFK